MNYKLRYLRERRGLSVRQMYERLGVKDSRYRKWESEAAAMPLEYAVEACEILRCSLDELLGLVVPAPSDDEQRLLDLYRSTDDRGRLAHHLRVFCRWMLSRLSCILSALFAPLMHFVHLVPSHLGRAWDAKKAPTPKGEGLNCLVKVHSTSTGFFSAARLEDVLRVQALGASHDRPSAATDGAHAVSHEPHPSPASRASLVPHGCTITNAVVKNFASSITPPTRITAAIPANNTTASLPHICNW